MQRFTHDTHLQVLHHSGGPGLSITLYPGGQITPQTAPRTTKPTAAGATTPAEARWHPRCPRRYPARTKPVQTGATTLAQARFSARNRVGSQTCSHSGAVQANSKKAKPTASSVRAVAHRRVARRRTSAHERSRIRGQTSGSALQPWLGRTRPTPCRRKTESGDGSAQALRLQRIAQCTVGEAVRPAALHTRAATSPPAMSRRPQAAAPPTA